MTHGVAGCVNDFDPVCTSPEVGVDFNDNESSHYVVEPWDYVRSKASSEYGTDR